ncbi:hypothetical protein C2G38_2164657 [Gigaspora rosea]|uniref:SPRY domain-containing protein n=1 Tax=Gigaspora rosea TaxID=44941 RepID=A0A397VW05_9GLOM|nr:hypothetical protein C2G38_2164657 [Gigaspora rosea]
MVGVGYCTKQNDKEIGDSNVKTNYIYNMLMPGQEYKKNEEIGLCGCGYHDDGYLFCSGSDEPYGPKYTTALYFTQSKVIFIKYFKELRIIHLPDDFKGIIYPYVEFRSQGRSIEVNFGRGNESVLVNLTNELEISLEKKQNIQGLILFLMVEYDCMIKHLMP